MKRFQALAAVTLTALVLSACGSKPASDETASGPSETSTANTPQAPAPTFASLKGDAATGETVFLQCKACHAVEAGKNGVGPSLAGIQNRKAGTVAGYIYSAANKASGLTWTDEQMFDFLAAPQKVVPGTKMSFGGISDAQKRADLIAYLNTLK